MGSHTRSTVAFFIIGLFAMHMRAEGILRVVKDFNVSGVVDRAVVIPAREFTFPRIEARSRAFLAEQKGHYSLLRLTIGTEASQVAEALLGVMPEGSEESRYKFAEEWVRKRGIPTWPIARLMAMKSGAVLNYRDRSGLREVLIAGASDPTLVRMDREEYRVLHFALEGPKDVPSAHILTFYVKADEKISASNALKLMHILQSAVTIQDISIRVRTTPWFINSPDFPLFYPFAENLALPSLLQLQLGRRLACSAQDGRVECSGHRFEP